MVVSSASNSELSSVVVRLGGFHLIMSFMGAVGYIMGGSGLNEVWNLIYVVDSTDKMLNGHAMPEHLRDHFRTHMALTVFILCKLEIDDSVREEIFFSPLVGHEQRCVPHRCIQFLNQVMLMHDSVRTKRCGDWKLHLETIHTMVPDFHASVHLAYVKCAHLYIQQI